MKHKKIIIFLLIIATLLTPCVSASYDIYESGIIDPYKLYTYEQMCSDIQTLQQNYPELISTTVIGQSVEGRDIPMFTLGKGDRNIIICASTHAREYVTTNFVMYMAEQYCIGYRANKWFAGLSYRKLLDNVSFIIVPMLNPDGVVLAQFGIENAARRNQLEQMQLIDTWRNGYHAWKANINGVDLNRNWPYNWSEDSKIKSPASANYNGVAPCTEPEVIAMKELIDTTPFYMLCSFHSSGEAIYWIDTSNSTQMAKEFSPIISRLANFIGYNILGYENVMNFGGYMVNYARGTYQKPCFTVELCPINVDYPFSDYAGFEKTVNKVLPLGLIMADEVIKMSPEANKPSHDSDSNEIKVTVDGKELTFKDVGPIIKNSRTLVPIRAVCEAAGLKVSWDNGLVTVRDENTLVSLRIGSPEIFINEEVVPLDTAPIIFKDRTLLPIRAVLEAFGHSLHWDGESRRVNVLLHSSNNDVVIPE